MADEHALASRDIGRAAWLLRQARQRARLTQEELAESSGLAVRTIRSMESDSAGLPRRSSVLRLCAALEFEYAGRDELLTLYGLAPEPADVRFPYTRRGARPNVLDAAIQQTRSRLQVVSISSVAVIGHGRSLRHENEERVITARVDGVDRTYAFWDPNPYPGPELNRDNIMVTAVSGCSVGPISPVDGFGAYLFELVFPRPLRRGESWAYSYRLGHREADGAIPPGRPTAGFAGQILTDQLDVLTMRIDFRPEELPRDCQQIFRHRPGDRIQDVHRLEVVDGEAQLVLRNPRRGSHGIRWAW